VIYVIAIRGGGELGEVAASRRTMKINTFPTSSPKR
jgi:hypothetical protein